jgi:hypothetical protein
VSLHDWLSSVAQSVVVCVWTYYAYCAYKETGGKGAQVPVATVTERSRRFDLKTCPGGYVVVKRMTHGQKLYRADLTSKMKINASKKSKDVQGEIDLLQRQTAFWEFANLIEEHNLTALVNASDPGSDERPLNFKVPADVEMLDGRIGEEISTRIAEVNNFEEDADDEDSDLGN